VTDLRRATERIEREEFARGHIGPGEPPVEPRPAATIVLASTGFEGPPRVLLLRRPETTRFAAGAHVFAGGVIDRTDSDPKALERLPESLRRGEGAAAVAALRELFEETGILPTDRLVEPEVRRRVREDLLRGRVDFAQAAERLDARFHGLRAAYLARWITPARFARRYDTRFFLTVLGDDTAPEPELTAELDGYLWIEPGEAVRRFAAGQLPMLFPTRRTLQSLADEADLGELIRRCEGRRPDPIQPRLVVQGDSVRPVLPGDPEYDEAG
jgi:8-oxo-dGTP pyrophosphatase MutT (NUDIX family)